MQISTFFRSQLARFNGQRTTHILAIISLLTGIWLRIKDLTKFSLNYDELFTVSAAFDAGKNTNFFDFARKSIGQLSESDSFLTWKGADGSPPLFDLLLKTWGGVFSDSDYSLRLFSTLIGIAIPFAFYFGLRNLMNNTELLLGTSFLSFSNSLIAYSKHVRSYSLMALLVLLAWIIFYRLYLKSLTSENTKGSKLLLLAVLILLSYTHYTGLVVAGMILLAYFFLIVIPKREFQDLYLFLVLPLSLVPWIFLNYQVLLLSRNAGYGWREFDIFAEAPWMIRSVAEFTLTGAGIYLIVVLSLCFFTLNWNNLSKLFFAANGKNGPLKEVRESRVIFFNWLLLSIVGIYLYMLFLSQTANVWHTRYFTAGIPMIVLILTIAINTEHGKKKFIIGVSSFALLFTSLFTSFGNLESPSLMRGNDDYRGAAQFINQNMGEDSLIVLANSPSALIYKRYLDFPKDLKVTYSYLDTAQDLNLLCDNVQRENYVQIFVFATTPSSLINKDSDFCQYLQRVESPDFTNLAVYRYLKK